MSNAPSIQPTVDTLHRVRLTTRWLRPSSAVITVYGEVDASNAQEFVEYALRCADRMERLVLDLTGVGFLGTAGFSALHTVNVRCAAGGIDWVMVPSPAVSHLLGICDPDSTLPTCDSLQTALDAGHRKPAPLLQLIPKTG